VPRNGRLATIIHKRQSLPRPRAAPHQPGDVFVGSDGRSSVGIAVQWALRYAVRQLQAAGHDDAADALATIVDSGDRFGAVRLFVPRHNRPT
jgi:hypothetical protein